MDELINVDNSGLEVVMVNKVVEYQAGGSPWGISEGSFESLNHIVWYRQG